MEVRLPADLGSPHTLVLMGLRRAHQKQVDTWLAEVERLTGDHPGLDVVQTPLMGPQNRLVRGIVESAMRAQFKDRAQRERLIPLYVEPEPFLAQLGISDRDAAVVLLVDGGGAVLWMGRGSTGPEPLAELQATLTSSE